MENLIELIAHFADIDSRRALGFKPRKLPRSDFVPRPIAPTTFRYFAALKKLLYVNFDESYDVFTWEVYEDIETDGGYWFYGPHGEHRGVWRGLDDFMYFNSPPGLEERFQFAGQPDIISA